MTGKGGGPTTGGMGFVQWGDAVLKPAEVVTGEDVDKKPDPDDQLRKVIQISKWNPSLTVLYFHTDHEDMPKDKVTPAGVITAKQCKTLKDATAARWLSM